MKTGIIWEKRKIRSRKGDRKQILNLAELHYWQIFSVQVNSLLPIQRFHLHIETGWRKQMKVERRGNFCRCKRNGLPRNDCPQRFKTRYTKMYSFLWFKDTPATSAVKILNVSMLQGDLAGSCFSQLPTNLINLHPNYVTQFTLIPEATEYDIQRLRWNPHTSFWSCCFCNLNRILFPVLALFPPTYRQLNVTITPL